MRRPHVIILNGVGSVGKSSTAKALQILADEAFMHVSMDSFFDMLPERIFGDVDGLVFETVQVDGMPSVVIRTGPVVERALRGMRHAVAALVEQGNSVVVDEVMIGQTGQDYRNILSRFDVRFVGLFAPLGILEARECERGDRQLGLARWQFDQVHRDMSYDLEIDTLASTPMQSAKMILDAFGLRPADGSASSSEE
jgi:chloramphenicol 3-O phosphotransferase